MRSCLDRWRVSWGRAGVVLALVVGGCGESTDGVSGAEDAGAGGQTQPSGTGGASDGLGATGGVATTDGSVGDVDTGGTAAGAGAGAFCAVQALLLERCGDCHGEEGQLGPMRLREYDDFFAVGADGRRLVHELVLERVRFDPDPMPPVPYARLTAEELAVLDTWVAAGLPEPEQACADATDEGVAGSDGAEASCDGQVLQFLAHEEAVPDDATPFDVTDVGADGDPNHYECFYFKAPWEAGSLATSFLPVIDNSRVLHHWILYASASGEGLTDGGRRGNCEVQNDSDRVMLAGWAPGGDPVVYADDVGIALPAGAEAYLTLEIHYYNTQPGTADTDRSGAEVCVTQEERAHVAAPHWLGTESISIPSGAQADAEGMCTMNSEEVVTVIAISPHMHELGTHALMEVLRSDGSTEVVFDRPFDFDSQLTYMLDEPILLYPGDQVRSTCTYRNDTGSSVSYGSGTDDEMCYMFTTAYPVGALHNGQTGCASGLDLCIFPGSTNRCIDGLL